MISELNPDTRRALDKSNLGHPEDLFRELSQLLTEYKDVLNIEDVAEQVNIVASADETSFKEIKRVNDFLFAGARVDDLRQVGLTMLRRFFVKKREALEQEERRAGAEERNGMILPDMNDPNRWKKVKPTLKEKILKLLLG